VISAIVHFMINSSIRRDFSKLMFRPQFFQLRQDRQDRHLFKAGGVGGVDGGVAQEKDPLSNENSPCNNLFKPKGLVRENTLGYVDAAPSNKRGFITSEFNERPKHGGLMVLDEVGLTRKEDRTAYPVFSIPRPPYQVETGRVVSKSRYGAKPMTNNVNPEALALRAQAEAKLTAALELLRQEPFTPQSLQQATGRAIRVATLLKRACSTQKGGAL
jgi:hypothetical protein